MATTGPEPFADTDTFFLAANSGDEVVRIDDVELLFRGAFTREGSDLVLSHDGRTLVLTGYFLTENPPDLEAPNGAFLSGSIVGALAGPLAPAQYAQAAPIPSGLKEIGEVVTLTGSAKSTQINGTEVDLKVGDKVYQGDVIQTGADGKLGISFLDKTVFSLSENARMVLDELIYNPDDQANSSMLFNLVEGAFVFVTGQVAPNGNMNIQTPVATMGIRGTTPKVLINTVLGVVEFTVLPDPDSGKVGSYILVDPRTGLTIGRVDSAESKWVVTTLSGEAVRIGKSGLDLLEDQVALDQLRDVVSKALGNRTFYESHTFDQVAFNSSSGTRPAETSDDDSHGGGGGGGGGPNDTPDKDDAPIAGDDKFTLDEDSAVIANVIDGSVGGKDVDPDGFSVSVTQIDGANLNFVSGIATVTLPSGAVLKITPGGGFNYDAVDAFDWLAVGEQTTDTFTYTIRDQFGFVDTATVTVTIIGRNDQPEIQIVKVNGEIVDVDEDPNVPPQTDAGTLSDSGSITFTDVDLSNRPTATFEMTGISAIGQDGQPLVLTSEQIAAIQAAFSIAAADGNTNNGTINWLYAIQEVDVDFLGAGEVVTVVFTITVSDHSTGTHPNDEPATVSQDVTIVINGSVADAPKITAVDVVGAVSDIAETNPVASDGDIRQTTGSITFDDVDETDRPVATFETKSITATQGDNSALVLTQDQYDAIEAAFSINPDGVSGPNTNAGTVTWDYSILESELDFLAVGETVTVVYTITVTDDEGQTDTVDVTITITGANDHPLIRVETGDDVTETMQETEDTLTTSGSFSVLDVDVTDVVTVKSIEVATSDNDSGAPSESALLDMLTLTPGVNGTIIDGTETTDSVGWSFNSGLDQFDYLADGEQLTITYTVTVTDDNGAEDEQTITLVIEGTNDDPVISLETGDDVEETMQETEDTLTTSGSFSVLDVDVTDVVTVKSIEVATSDNDSGAPSESALLDMLTLTPGVNGTIIDGTETTGSVGWSFNSGLDQFDYLADGEQLTITYTVTVTDDNGAEDQQTITLVIEGTNDDPVISLETGDDVEETMQETEDTLTTSGSFSVLDVDVTDVVTVKSIEVATSDNDSGAPSESALLDMLTLTPGVDGTIIDGTETTGSVGWSFNSGLDQFDYLADGEQLTITYTVTVTDDNGAEDEQTITLVIEGTNDDPEIAAATGDGIDTGAVTELPDGDTSENDFEHSATGSLAFSDVDASDTHTVSFEADANNPTDLPSATFTLTNGGTLNADGTIDWEFTVDDADLDFLGEGETREFTYTVEIDDGNGGTDTRDVTITVTGTNDAPVIAAAAETITIAFSVTLGLDGYGSIGPGETLNGLLLVDAGSGEPISLTLSHPTEGSFTSTNVTISALNDVFGGTTDVIVVQASDLLGELGGIDPGTANMNLDLRGPNTVLTSTEITYDASVWNQLTNTTLQMPDPDQAEPRTAATGVGVIEPFDDFVTGGPTTGAITELPDGDAGENTDTLSTGGSLAFTDVDANDTHTVTVDADADNPTDLPSATFTLTNEDTLDDDGTIEWQFTVDDADLDFLGEGETREFTYTVTLDDNEGGTTSQDIVVTVTGTNDAPEVTAGAELNYYRNDGAVGIDGTITVNDVDSPMLAGATISISENFVSGEDVLGFTDQNGIVGSYNPATGVLTLTGPATLADYQTALQSVTYTNTGEPPTEEPREISFSVNDGLTDSEVATATINVSAYDMIVGTETGDELGGDALGDIIFGLGGSDILHGGGGDDIIHGGPGSDYLLGDAGADTYVFHADDGEDADNVNYEAGNSGNSFVPVDILDLSDLLEGFGEDWDDYITFEGGDGITEVIVDGQTIANLAGVNEGDTLSIIHDDQMAAAVVTVAYTGV